MRNTPVLLTINGAQQAVVYNPERAEDDAWMYGGMCTGVAKSRKARCGNIVWDQGQVAGYGTIYVGDLVVPVMGPLPEPANRRHIEQRCRVHDTPDAAAYCDPEWELFNPDRHAAFGHTPTMHDVFGYTHDLRPNLPPLNILATALRGHFTKPELEQLARLLTD
ncbi:hypothetical protein [Nonomuraea sp. NPDC023979]|uniref:hypothetical protein n=1 Tax=Nonomuraea sp. NPDC023979 TaxID=3154796 RepID=UPI00340535BB